MSLLNQVTNDEKVRKKEEKEVDLISQKQKRKISCTWLNKKLCIDNSIAYALTPIVELSKLLNKIESEVDRKLEIEFFWMGVVDIRRIL